LAQPEIAIALRYDPAMGELPHVTAKGRGLVAERICELARGAGVPVRQDPDLAQMLEKLDLGTPIPLAAFAAVAEILAHLYCLNAQLEGGKNG
jgi:flagellar biosynthesis protein